MKKKVICSVSVVIVLLICIIIYFKPIPLSNIAVENSRFSAILTEYGFRNTEAYLDSAEFQDITAEQNSAILMLFEDYTYSRTFGTLFSNGSMSGLGKNMLSIYIYDGDLLVDNIFVASTGKIAVKGKVYNMKEAEQFIAQFIEIVE